MKAIEDIQTVGNAYDGYLTKEKYKKITAYTEFTTSYKIAKTFGSFTVAKVVAGFDVKQLEKTKPTTHNARQNIFCRDCAYYDDCGKDILNCEFYEHIDEYFKPENFIIRK